MPVVAVDGHAASENEPIIWGVRLLVFEKMEALLLALPLKRASYSFDRVLAATADRTWTIGFRWLGRRKNLRCEQNKGPASWKIPGSMLRNVV